MSFDDLSPSEALFLLDPGFGDGRKALKLSLRWLIAHGYLNATCEAKPGPWIFRNRPRLQLAENSRTDRRLPQDLEKLIELVQSAPTEFFDDILPIIPWTYGASSSILMGETIRQHLVARQFLEVQSARMFLGLKQQAYERTPAGKEVCERLASLLDRAREIPHIIATDAKRVAALAAPLGGLLLVLTELRPEWGQIADALSRYGSGRAIADTRFDPHHPSVSPDGPEVG